MQRCLCFARLEAARRAFERFQVRRVEEAHGRREISGGMKGPSSESLLPNNLSTMWYLRSWAKLVLVVRPDSQVAAIFGGKYPEGTQKTGGNATADKNSQLGSKVFVERISDCRHKFMGHQHIYWL